MGIPHLISFVEPYAALDSLDGQHVVIDGPGLAYHIYYVCLSSRSPTHGAFGAIPSYKELGDATIAWLDGIRKCGVIVERVYFDGFLPSSKFAVRLKRLAKQTKQLVGYYHKNPRLCQAPFPSTRDVPRSLYTWRPAPYSLTTLSPPPFLVPAILEALGASEHYKDIIGVVPGEADLYCARYLKQHGGIVLTGDSDLLIHDLGSDGAVGFFKDITASLDGKPNIFSQIYRPTAIADRLGLPKTHGLRALAFEIFMDNHGTFRKLLMQATSLKAVKRDKDMYEDFGKEYLSLAAGPQISDTGECFDSSKVAILLRSLDPRISEYVLQFPFLAEISGQSSRTVKSDVDAIHVFLPFLLDCPVRTSAWEMTTSIRQLAYGIINLLVPESQQISSVFEHRKEQTSSSGREWQLPIASEIDGACLSLTNLLNQLLETLPDLSGMDLWIAVGVFQDVEWATSNSKPVFSHLVAKQLADLEDGSTTSNTLTWDILHFLAQIQGSYYSFRILKQIIGLLVSSAQNNLLAEPFIPLYQRLNCLPALEDLQDLSNICSVIRRIGIAAILSSIHGILGIASVESSPTLQSSSKQTKTKRKGNPVPTELPNRRSRHSNPFESLSVD